MDQQHPPPAGENAIDSGFQSTGSTWRDEAAKRDFNSFIDYSTERRINDPRLGGDEELTQSFHHILTGEPRAVLKGILDYKKRLIELRYPGGISPDADELVTETLLRTTIEAHRPQTRAALAVPPGESVARAVLTENANAWTPDQLTSLFGLVDQHELFGKANNQAGANPDNHNAPTRRIADNHDMAEAKASLGGLFPDAGATQSAPPVEPAPPIAPEALPVPPVAPASKPPTV